MSGCILNFAIWMNYFFFIEIAPPIIQWIQWLSVLAQLSVEQEGTFDLISALSLSLYKECSCHNCSYFKRDQTFYQISWPKTFEI